MHLFTWLSKKTFSKKSNIKYYKKKVMPKQAEKQMVATKMKCDRLFTKSSDQGFILDGGSYFKLSPFTVNDNDIYYARDVSKTKSIIKFTTKAKLEKDPGSDCDGIEKLESSIHPKISVLYQRATTFEQVCIRRHMIFYIGSNTMAVLNTGF